MVRKSDRLLTKLLNEPATENVSELIKAWRDFYDLTQTCAADILGVGARTLQGWELGRSMPFPRMLQTAIFSYVNSKGIQVEFLNNLPKEIGSHIQIPSWDEKLRRIVEGRGFIMEHGTPQTYIMRRVFNDGVLKTDA